MIAIDAMGGDSAPSPEVAGAVQAVRELGLKVLLLGNEERLRQELARLSATDLDIPIRHCEDVITMHDHPSQAARSKRGASMRVAFDLLRRDEVQAVVSAGNSGAMLACGLLVLGRLPGVERPAIISTFPSLHQSEPARGPGRLGECALLDMGANVECKASTLSQFAVLGATFSRLHTGKALPRVGLLSNGEEDSKGTELLREAHALLSRYPDKDFDYVGFVEGRDIFYYRGGLDVVVTDGFTGNIVLKTAEGAARLIGELFRHSVRQSILGRLGALLMLPALRSLKKTIDVERRGGAVLLGVSGVVIICHGSSSPRAIRSAIALAQEQVDAGMAPAVQAAIARHRPLWKEPSTAQDAP